MNIFTGKQVLRRFMKSFAEKYHNDSTWKNRFDSGEDACLDELLDKACSELRVTRADYLKVFDGSAALQKLQKQYLMNITLGPVGTYGPESKGAGGIQDPEVVQAMHWGRAKKS
ncbi:MAG: hypothetical protein AAB263_16335 [Planctomycetota bacterium]